MMDKEQVDKLLKILAEYQRVQRGLMERVEELEKRLLLNQTSCKN